MSEERNILNLIRTICANGESGRLEILAGAIQGELSFKDGKLVDARVGHLTGFQAINAVASMQDARASFDPAFETLASSSIRPSERVVLKQFFGIDTAEAYTAEAYIEPVERAYIEPAVMSQPEEVAPILPPPVAPEPETADEVTIVRSNSAPSVRTNAVPSSLPLAPRNSFPTGILVFAALVIAMLVGAVVLIDKLRERSTPAVVAGTQSSSGSVAAPVQQSEPAVAQAVPASPQVKENHKPRVTTQNPSANTTAQNLSGNTTAQNLSGKWNLVNTVETSSYNSFKNMKIGFHVSIDQNGTSFTGSGQKVSENGRPLPVKSRTPIQVKGSIKGDRVEATFFEEGTARKTNGRFVWRIDRAGRGLTGNFATTAARSKGKSAAIRL